MKSDEEREAEWIKANTYSISVGSGDGPDVKLYDGRLTVFKGRIGALLRERDEAKAELAKLQDLVFALKDTIRILEADLDREQDLHAQTQATLYEVRAALGIAPGVKVQDAAGGMAAVVAETRKLIQPIWDLLSSELLRYRAPSDVLCALSKVEKAIDALDAQTKEETP